MHTSAGLREGEGGCGHQPRAHRSPGGGDEQSCDGPGPAASQPTQDGEPDARVDGQGSSQVDLDSNLGSAAQKLPGTLGKFPGLSEAASASIY